MLLQILTATALFGFVSDVTSLHMRNTLPGYDSVKPIAR